MIVPFVIAVVLFHVSEIAFVAAFQRENLSWRSALLSPPYLAMLVAALVEWGLERRHAPWIKVEAVAWSGVALVAIGEAIRKTAMLTAAGAFTHEIAEERRDGHRLVTRGIYRFVRHPGYLGWFLWAIGAQLILVNPLTTVIAAVAAQRFFAARIPHEEALLRRFFPEYDAYRARTRTFLPFIA
jgi:protein-S-isoprenylcysteine O-methyltransferase